MKYIKLFETASAFESARATLDLPNVSLIEATNGLNYLPYVAPAPDPYNGHEYVEIGGLKWATMNIGANSITDYGLYFQWGDTQGYTASQVGSGSGQKYFGWADYKYGNGTSSPGATGMTKYNSTDGKTVLEAVDDAAQANWGGAWRMPTVDDINTFYMHVNTTRTTNYQDTGVEGLVCTDKTDSSKVIFLPAAGYFEKGITQEIGTYGYYLKNNLCSFDKTKVGQFYFYYGGTYWDNNFDRLRGVPIRPVAN